MACRAQRPDAGRRLDADPSPALSWALRVLYLAREAREERELRVRFFLVAMLMSSLPARDVGRKTSPTTWIN